MRRIASVSVVLALLALPGIAQAATIEVTTRTDHFYDVLDECSLRESITAANMNFDFAGCVRTGGATPDVIVLEGGRNYQLSIPGVSDDNSQGDLDISEAVELEVSGTGRATINGGDLDRVIEVLPGARLVGSRLIIRNGTVGEGQTIPDAGGGGILAHGRLALSESTVEDNHAPAYGCLSCPTGGGLDLRGGGRLTRVRVADNVADYYGGGIYSLGDLAIAQSTIKDNDAGFNGGGLAVVGDGTLTMARSTISGNRALNSGASAGHGGGIYAINDATGSTIVNSTISGNSANGFVGGLYDYFTGIALNGVTITENIGDANGDGTGGIGGIFGEPLIRNSIIAGNMDLNPGYLKHDCDAGQGDDAHNLVGRDGGCGESGSNTAAADPRLGPLQDNGGPTETHALGIRSRAIGLAGVNAPPRDQRGVARDADPDAGSFER